jgi:branched-chain amino acid transport system substrate-binding protein
MKSRSTIYIIVSLIALVAIYFFYEKTKVKPVETSLIKIAAVLPLTGDVASYGNDSKDGIDLAVELANKSQSKYKFVVEYQDSKGEPKTAVTVLEKIFSTSKPVAVIGENISSSTASMIPITDKHQTLLISPSASAPNLSGISSYFFRVFPSDVEEGAFIANAISKSKPNSKVCIVYVNNDYGVGLKGVFELNAKHLGLNVLQTFGYDKTTSDFKAILTKVKSLNPDAIYMPSYYQDGGAIVKQVKELGINAELYGGTTHEDPKFLEVAGSAAEGFKYPVATGFDANSQDTIVKIYISNFKTKFNKEPGLVSALGYDCVQLIIDGVLKNGTTTESIKTYILNTKDIHGAAGTMNFDNKGDVHKPIILKTVKDGKFIIL